jgi:ribbon-helix-helix CopG family protein
VIKTTVLLPPDLKARVEATARARGCSQAAVIRDAVDRYTTRPRPRLPLFSAEPLSAERVDEILAEGFGEV